MLRAMSQPRQLAPVSGVVETGSSLAVLFSVLLLLDRARGRREYCVGVGTDQSDRTHDNDKDHSQHHGVFRDILAFIVCPESRNEIGHGNSSELFYFHGWMQRVSLIR